MEPWQPLLTYWFGEIQEPGVSPRDKYDLWFSSNAQVDLYLTQTFSGLLIQAEQGQLNEWQRNPQGWLALILLLDQLSRNIYRGTRKAFANDEHALQLAKQGLQLGIDEQLPFIQRTFFYMPFEHSERLEDQDHAVTLFDYLEQQVPEALKKEFHSYTRFAKLHRQLIGRFGRFPHRNKVLQRESTSDELQFLNAGGQRFGQ